MWNNELLTAEEERLESARDQKSHWKRWGPYLSERQGGTVREDYSPFGTAWDSFSHDQRAPAPTAGVRTGSGVSATGTA